jgi:hypothetical protein
LVRITYKRCLQGQIPVAKADTSQTTPILALYHSTSTQP